MSDHGPSALPAWTGIGMSPLIKGGVMSGFTAQTRLLGDGHMLGLYVMHCPLFSSEGGKLNCLAELWAKARNLNRAVNLLPGQRPRNSTAGAVEAEGEKTRLLRVWRQRGNSLEAKLGRPVQPGSPKRVCSQ
ncbi:uncharacterized protein A4U43_C08F17480 [Asparagus officinalis]|nr:uncharacterized protein A4U43_C08F17480 [Asparagus officinalis]